MQASFFHPSTLSGRGKKTSLHCLCDYCHQGLPTAELDPNELREKYNSLYKGARGQKKHYQTRNKMHAQETRASEKTDSNLNKNGTST